MDVRLDKWLWAARFFKTRSQAAAAISAGHCDCDGQRVKAGKRVHVGDELTLRKGPYRYAITVLALSETRGSAADAQTLCQESPDSVRARQQVAEELKLDRALGPPAWVKVRPTKKDRRTLTKLKRPRG